MLNVRLLGSIEVLRDGRPIRLAPRAVGVLVRLALEGAPVSRDRLLMDLWGPDVTPDRRRSLETLISTLRRLATGRAGLVFDSGSYDLTVPVEVDIEHVLDADRMVVTRSWVRCRDLGRGEPRVHQIGMGEWVEDLERRVRAGLAVLGKARATPAVEYVVSDGRHIAYQDQDYQDRSGNKTAVLLLAGLATHCEGIWEAPGFREWIDAALGEHRLVMFDKRGTGLSDPVSEVPSDLEFVDDAIAVLRATGVKRVVLICAAEAGMYGPHIASRHPDLVAGVVFVNAIARMFETSDFPCGLPEEIARRFGDAVRETWAREDIGLGVAAPSRAHDDDFKEWATRYQRLVATPGSIWQLAQYTAVADGRAAIAAMTQPSLVIQSRHSSYFRPSNARWLCDALDLQDPVWLDSADHLFWIADPVQAAGAIAEFLVSVDGC